ncbi:MAG: VCBS repeat-containing protein [Myxococcales bacterium]|nr:VCBS repeat-containing protein [Myxococcales bacterium]
MALAVNSRVWLTFVLLLGAGASTSRAEDWPVFRHDARRTAQSNARLGIDRPAIRFQTYLGGALGRLQVLDLDVTGDGRHEVVYVSGGRVVAKRGNNIAVWESEILPIDELWGAVDLDGDGDVELIATRTRPVPAALVILSARDGSVRWQMPLGTTDWFQRVALGDLDGDGRDDLYIGSGMCGTGVEGPPGVAFSFCDAAGCDFGRARELWRLVPGTPAGDAGNCGSSGVIADLTGDGRQELMIPFEYQRVPFYAGASGTRLGALPPFEHDYDRSSVTVLPVQLDDDPALEVVSYVNAFNGGRGGRRLAVHDLVAGDYTTLWEVWMPDRAGDRVVADLPGSVRDLDGDGRPEVVVGRFEASTGRWTTTVHHPLTGAVRASLEAQLQGVVDVDGDGRAEIFATAAGRLRAYRFDAAGTLEERFALEARGVVRVDDAARRPRTLASTRVFTMQLDDDPAPELVLGEWGTGGLVALHAYDADVAPPVLRASFRAPEGTTILAALELGPVTRDHAQPGVVTSDGYFLVLDRNLNVTNRITDGEFTEPGMRVGGYYTGASGLRAAPIVATLSDGPAVLVSDSRGALLRFDARAASPIEAPVVRDALFGARFPSVVELAGERGVLVVEGTTVALREAGPGLGLRWRSPPIVDAGIFGDAVPASLVGGAPSVVGSAHQPTGDWLAYAIDAGTGALRWRTPTPRLLGWGVGNNGLHAVGDVTGDGVDDVTSVVNGVSLVNGADPTDVRHVGGFMARGATLLSQIDGAGPLAIYAHGAYHPSTLVRDGAVEWTFEPRMALDSFAARATCAGETVFVGGAFGSAELWTVRGRDASVLAHRAFAGGADFVPGTIPASVRPGALGNVTSVAGVDGAGRAGVLVGSSDGHLYALDPCTLTLRWALDLRYPVGEAVPADVDGDGVDEIVVSVADGNLYGITNAAYDAPNVRDIVPGMPDVDVDVIDSVSSLHAAWDPVEGASSYLVSAFTEQGSPLRFPNARDVGDVTVVELAGLPLQPGRRYYVAVQAVGPAGPGLEGRSDGVLVDDVSPADAMISVEPAVSWPAGGVEPTIRASCVDAFGVRRLQLLVRRGDEPIAWLASEDGAARPNIGVTHAWRGLDEVGNPVPAGVYTARVECLDARDRESFAEVDLTLDPAAATPGDAGVGADAGADSSEGGGCGCRTPSGSFAGGWLWVLLSFGARHRRASRRCLPPAKRPLKARQGPTPRRSG